MSLSTVNLMEVVKKQYVFKLKANIDALSSLVGIQLLAILFSFGGVGSIGSSSESININVKYYSADLVIAFTMVWAFVSAITITTKPYRHYDFTFVTNRISSSISNGFIFTDGKYTCWNHSDAFGVFAIGFGLFFFDEQVFSIPIVAGDQIIGIVVSILYVFCASSMGYLVGTLVQVSKVFIVLIPVSVIGTLFLWVPTMQGKEPLIANVYRFYFTESSLSLFMIKIVITTALFFAASISILNRLEVRR